MRRSMNVSAPGFYELPGGWIEDDETFLETGRREVLEETGCRVKAIAAIGIADSFVKDYGIHNLNVIMAAVLEDGEVPKIIEPGKCDLMEWRPMSDFYDIPKPRWMNYADFVFKDELEKFLDEHC